MRTKYPAFFVLVVFVFGLGVMPANAQHLGHQLCAEEAQGLVGEAAVAQPFWSKSVNYVSGTICQNV